MLALGGAYSIDVTTDRTVCRRSYCVARSCDRAVYSSGHAPDHAAEPRAGWREGQGTGAPEHRGARPSE